MMKLLLAISLFVNCSLVDYQSRYPSNEVAPVCQDIVSAFLQGEKGIHAIGPSRFGRGDSFIYTPPVITRSINEIDQLKLASYNVLNLEDYKGKWVENPQTGERTLTAPASSKPIEQTKGVSRAIKDLSPDIAVLLEVESVETLQRFNKEYLNDDYIEFSFPGNDSRGIDIAFMLKKDLPLTVEFHSFKNHKADYLGKESVIFSRDLPALVFYSNHKKDKPLFILLGTHFKSMRDSAGDPESSLKRKAQVLAALQVVSDLKAHFGQTLPVLIAGDFNNDLHSASEFVPFKGQFEDSFDVAESFVGHSRVTHTYHPNEGPVVQKQIDGILIDSQSANKEIIKEAGIYRYKNEAGDELPIPTTRDQRDQNPSDHFPIFSILNFDRLLN